MMFSLKGKWLRMIWTGLMNTRRRKSRLKNGIEKMGGADTWLFPRPIDGYAPARDAKKLDLKNLCQPTFSPQVDVSICRICHELDRYLSLIS